MTDTAEPTAEDVPWVQAALDAIPTKPVRRAARSPGVDPAFAAAVRHQLHKRDREIEALRTELRELRNEIAVGRKLDEIMNQLDKLEGSAPRTGLRVA